MWDWIGLGLVWASSIGLHTQLASKVSEWSTQDQQHRLHRWSVVDLVHENVPSLQLVRWIPEVLHVVPPIVLIAQMSRDVQGPTHFQTFGILHAFLMLCRALCFTSTILPDVSGMCQNSQWIGSCSDLMFSGHAMIVALSSCFLIDWYSETLFQKLSWIVFALITDFFIVATRNHQTVDVLVANMITVPSQIAIQNPAFQKYLLCNK